MFLDFPCTVDPAIVAYRRDYGSGNLCPLKRGLSMMSHVRQSVGYAVLIVLLSGASAWAQATAAISGTVRDSSGGVLPGVTITATQQDTGIVRTTVSNETGAYSLPNLPLGPYRVEAELAGFRRFAQTGIVLQVGGNPVV